MLSKEEIESLCENITILKEENDSMDEQIGNAINHVHKTYLWLEMKHKDGERSVSIERILCCLDEITRMLEE